MKATTKSIAYWTTTGIVVFGILSGGISELAHRPETIDGMKQLGYPVYFVMILGFWKLLGSLALLAPGFPRVKEWAYAGIFFNMTGAAASHLVCHDAAWHVAVTLGFAALAVVSWALRPESRTFGNLFGSDKSSEAIRAATERQPLLPQRTEAAYSGPATF